MNIRSSNCSFKIHFKIKREYTRIDKFKKNIVLDIPEKKTRLHVYDIPIFEISAEKTESIYVP